MHEKCMKTWNKMQKEGHKGLTGLERGKPCKNFEGKWPKKKKTIVEPSQVEERERERKDWKVWKNKFETIQSDFLKQHYSRVSIDRKTSSIDWNRQRL